jgi:hypothetical protein
MDATSCHEFFHMARAQRVRDIPADTAEDNILGKMGPLETHRHRSPPSLLTGITEEEHSPNRLKRKLRQNPCHSILIPRKHGCL